MSQRDPLFPTTSIGRAHLDRTPDRDSLAVHPLLNAPDSAKYVPYTPRQRQQTTPTTVPAKPQLADLRAAAHAIGLDASSLGWAMLEKIAYEGDTSDEWSEIWHALTRAKATLLLPSEPAPGHDAITPELVQDHLALCDDTALITLSGLRAHLVQNAITFRSTLHRSTRPFRALWTPSASRVASLGALPPLPAHPPESSYPAFAVAVVNGTLPLPARATKPPLPPRPGTRGAPTGRLSNPFASLFGQRPSTPPLLPATTPVPTARPSTPTPTDTDTIDISALVLATPLSRSDIATAITNALKAELAVALADGPPWLVERVHVFAQAFFPFVKLPAGKKKLQDIGGGTAGRVAYAVNATAEKPEEMAERFQAFYRAVEDELRSVGREQEQEQETSDARDLEVDEERIRDVLETIEAALCTLLYDRLFLPSTSDDASHNEALSSRIAALNMLDLSLEHLDIDIGDANHTEVDAVVRTCGQTLAQLDSARSPREKAAVLVSAHKLVVEGLSKIPPIRLKIRDPNPTEATELASMTATNSAQSPSMPSTHLSTSPNQSPAVKPTGPSSPPSPVSGDVLLPILIFSVVKSNPPRLVSHLLFIQRFRNQSFGGEESYCLINLMAVAEFLENVDLGALGLGESADKVLSTADLTPIPIARPKPASPVATTTTVPGLLPGEEPLASLRGRVGQGVDAIAGSANKVISGVVDTSFGVLRAFLPGQAASGAEGSAFAAAAGVGAPARSAAGAGAGTGAVSGPATVSPNTGTANDTADAALWGVRPGLGLLRRETGFSIAGLTAALPGGVPGRRHSARGEPGEEGQRELVEVGSRPASLRSHQSGHDGEGSGDEGAEGEGEEEREGAANEDGDEGASAGDATEESESDEVHDARSIKSFESMLSGGRARRHGTDARGASRRQRLTGLTDRLTHGMAGMSRRVQGGEGQRATTGMAAAALGRLPPPNRRFVECTEQDIRVSEVGQLLREYQRLVEAVRGAGGFQE